jgi:hypothetical protein
MPAVSQAQQKLMGMTYALKKGDMKPEDASQEVKDLADSMSLEDLKDFAETSHEGLPAKKEAEETPKTDKPKNIKTFEEFVSDMKGESVNAEGEEEKDTKEVEEENKESIDERVGSNTFDPKLFYLVGKPKSFVQYDFHKEGFKSKSGDEEMNTRKAQFEGAGYTDIKVVTGTELAIMIASGETTAYTGFR